MKTAMKLTAVALLMAAMPLTANAQFARNNSAPIDATADDIVNSAGTTILSGQVDVRQGDTRILADKMKILAASLVLAETLLEVIFLVSKRQVTSTTSPPNKKCAGIMASMCSQQTRLRSPGTLFCYKVKTL